MPNVLKRMQKPFFKFGTLEIFGQKNVMNFFLVLLRICFNSDLLCFTRYVKVNVKKKNLIKKFFYECSEAYFNLVASKIREIIHIFYSSK